MSQFIINCPQCGQQLQADTDWVGMECGCPNCQHKIIIPSPVAPVTPNLGGGAGSSKTSSLRGKKRTLQKGLHTSAQKNAPNNYMPPPASNPQVSAAQNGNFVSFLNHYYFDVFKTKYFCFTGRTSRKEYWMFILCETVVLLLTCLPLFADNTDLFLIFTSIVILATWLPAFGMMVRRLHDQDKSGWLALTAFIPYVGGFIITILMALPGTPGPNRFEN